MLACSREELDALVVKLVAAAARETEQTSGSRDEVHEVGAWSAPPAPVLKVGGRVLLCSAADLPRELPAGVPGTCEPDNDGETENAFIVVHASNAPPVYIDNTRPKVPPRADNGNTGPGRGATVTAAPGENEGTSRVLRMHLPSGRRAQQHIFVHEVLPRAVSFARSHLGLGRKIHVVAGGGGEGIGVALVLLQLFFDDEGRLLGGGDVPGGGAAATKSSVRTRLEWIIASQPRINPSRAILKRVNDFLLSSHPHRQNGTVRAEE